MAAIVFLSVLFRCNDLGPIASSGWFALRDAGGHGILSAHLAQAPLAPWSWVGSRRDEEFTVGQHAMADNRGRPYGLPRTVVMALCMPAVSGIRCESLADGMVVMGVIGLCWARCLSDSMILC